MPAKTWTPAMIRRFKKEYPYITNSRDLAKKLHVSYEALKSKATVLKIHRKVPNYHPSTATKKEDLFLKRNYMKLPEKRMADILGRSDVFIRTRLNKLKLKKPRWLIEKFIQDSRIKPGNVSFNKGKKQKDYMSKEAIERTKATRFKKGETNHNELYDGAITIRHNHKERGEKPHKYIRISKGVWRELQIYNWEKKYGPIPKGLILACRNGDTLNCKPSNWYLMSKKDNVLRNSSSLRLTDGYVAFTIVGKNGMHLYNDVIKNKELIEAKRLHLKLNRKIKEYEKQIA